MEGPEDAQITLELSEETEYEITIDGKSAGTMKTNLGGKLSLSVELEGADAVDIKVENENPKILLIHSGTANRYGKNENQCVFLPELRIRISKMDGAMSGLQGVEYLCGRTGRQKVSQCIR